MRSTLLVTSTWCVLASVAFGSHARAGPLAEPPRNVLQAGAWVMGNNPIGEGDLGIYAGWALAYERVLSERVALGGGLLLTTDYALDPGLGLVAHTSVVLLGTAPEGFLVRATIGGALGSHLGRTDGYALATLAPGVTWVIADAVPTTLLVPVGLVAVPGCESPSCVAPTAGVSLLVGYAW